ncbi:MAG: MarR family winged helix-turn-helix transcriptional regulator [Microbacterium sp.]|uniref:MarR family winged helix-turn-helix transcriptional regulator n=1 Tax=Microbacterium sp. TaxID=51671 RepID=UPI0039E56853
MPQSRGAPEPLAGEVDLVIGGWRHELPDVDFSPLEVFSRLRRLAAALQTERARSFERAGLETGEFEILSSLCVAPHGTSTPSELSALTRTPSATMANRAERLEQRGYVKRRWNPDDTRSRIVRITPEGRQAAERGMRELVAAETRMLGALSAEQRAQLVELLRVLGAEPEARKAHETTRSR